MIPLSLALASPPPVIGGQPAENGRWPDVVALFSDGTAVCTGTLIAPDLVLSAEHCYNITTASVGPLDHADAPQVDVVERFDHPDATNTFDVSVFRLAEPSVVTPRALLRDCLADFYVDGVTTTVVGYGRVEPNGPGQTLLMAAELPIGDADCSDTSRGCRSAVSPGGELIAGGDGVDSCVGDSGGPLYMDIGAGEYLAGIVSRGAFPASSICGDGGIYVRADAIAPWIEETVGVELPRPDSCDGLNRPPAPTAEDIELTQGRSAPIVIDAGDPDADDTHTYTVLEGPSAGWVDDSLVFTADSFQVGAETLVVRVTDDGSPPLSAEVALTVRVFPSGHLDSEPREPAPTGCATGPAPVWTFTRRR